MGEAIAAHAGATVENARVDYNDPCWFFFTSGTTGRSKAAVLTHGQMAFVVTNHLSDLMPGTTENDASLVVAPLSHGAGVHQLVQTARGVPTILLPSERFDVNEAFRLIEAHRVSNIFTVPTILKMMVEHPAIERYDHSSLRYVIYAGAPMTGRTRRRRLASSAGCWCSISAWRGHRQHHGAAAGAARARGWPDGADRELRIERTGMQVRSRAIW